LRCRSTLGMRCRRLFLFFPPPSFSIPVYPPFPLEPTRPLQAPRSEQSGANAVLLPDNSGVRTAPFCLLPSISVETFKGQHSLFSSLLGRAGKVIKALPIILFSGRTYSSSKFSPPLFFDESSSRIPPFLLQACGIRKLDRPLLPPSKGRRAEHVSFPVLLHRHAGLIGTRAPFSFPLHHEEVGASLFPLPAAREDPFGYFRIKPLPFFFFLDGQFKIAKPPFSLFHLDTASRAPFFFEAEDE